MKKLLQRLLAPPVIWISDRFSSSPNKTKVFKALGELYNGIVTKNDKVNGLLVERSAADARIVIFSDQHKGRRNGADDFRDNEANYCAALQYYLQQNYTFVNLGDSEELWENNILQVIKHNETVHQLEASFIQNETYVKVYGNHDNFWNLDPLAGTYLKQMFGTSVKVYEGVVLHLQLDNGEMLPIFGTHGHQGDDKSDGNWLSAAFVSYIWAPLQAFLGINPNSPSNSNALKSLHNQFMYEWSALSAGIVLITGHTHQPVFQSHTHLERLYIKLDDALAIKDEILADTIRAEIPKRMQQFDHVQADFRSLRPSYFNTGCCCYNNGNITGIEISDNCIRLVKWSKKEEGYQRQVAEEMKLNVLADLLKPKPLS